MPKDNATRFISSHSFDVNYHGFLTEDGYQSLRAYLGNVRVGNDTVYDTPFAKGESTKAMLDAWNQTLLSIEHEWPSLMEFENDMRSKVGPMSIQKPLMQRINDIAHYYQDVLEPGQPILPRAIKAVEREFERVNVRIRSQSKTVELMKKSTNSGTPFFAKRRNVIMETLPCELHAQVGRHPSVWGKQHGTSYNYAAVLGWRGQEGGPSEEDVKQRVIWMFPFALNIAELQVYQPLIEVAQRFDLVPAWVSMESVDRRITNLFDSKKGDDLVVCTDFSRFDQHFNEHLQNAAKTILRSVITGGDAWLRDVFPAKYYIPLIWEVDDPEEITCFEGFHGMASGSGGTNVDETLAHRALQYEAAILQGKLLNPHSMCLGDDGILTYPGITVDDVVEAYQSHGQECNVAKQYASTQDCVYLRRWHHKDYRWDGICVGVYSTFRALGRMRYLERFMNPEYWSEEMVELRYLSIIENCKYHPLFEEFVDFCMKRDKYRLGIDIPGFLEHIVDTATEAIDHMQDFLGYTKTLQGFTPNGIAEWRVVKYLKSKA